MHDKLLPRASEAKRDAREEAGIAQQVWGIAEIVALLERE